MYVGLFILQTSHHLHSHLRRVSISRQCCSPSLSHANADQQGEAKLGPISSTFSVMETATLPKKDLPCKYCQRRFRRLEHVQRHERTHTKETPYKCTFGRSFSRSLNFNSFDQPRRSLGDPTLEDEHAAARALNQSLNWSNPPNIQTHTSHN
ncbi:hypothetical protein EDD36DRAFT_189721 [Exophiala viscosa]|uniref:C2H2-type domain-containing protein n=1 Tax=Exophiala viscosa TaxID=2486360 RepID=A0AAN6E1S3_9EURO|nr:hypothetical protein EDD36DRAFT_189721 [Exophiala viscosa]